MNYRLHDYIKNFSNIKVLVVGDAMLDRYLSGAVERICREAPVPIVDIQELKQMPGGAANAAVNLATLGAQTIFCSIVGDDTEGASILNSLKKYQIDTSGVVTDNTYKTMTKTRIISKNQILMRFDTGDKDISLSKKEPILLENLGEVFHQVDAILISDYGYGCINDTTRKILQTLQKKMKKIIVVDAKYPELYKDFPATAIKPNFQEALRILGFPQGFLLEKRAEKIIEFRQTFIENTTADIIAVTLDNEGSVIIANNGSYCQTATIPQPDSNAAGAGDTFISSFLLALASGASIKDSGSIASQAASITVQKSETAFCTNEELQESCYNEIKYISKQERMKSIIDLLKKSKKSIVFTNGCFDILHSGHINYLHRAKSIGDILIVGINSDNSIKRIKGESRPINTLFDRMQVLSGLESVDYIIPFEEDTPISLIQQIKPNIYVKGGDYTRETLPETPVVEQLGGKVIILPFIPNKSTTNIIKKITSQHTLFTQ